MTRRSSLPAVLCAVLLGACAKSEEPPQRADSPTRAQRDSAIGRSGLPGSKGVMNALGAADSARARQARIDSASRR